MSIRYASVCDGIGAAHQAWVTSMNGCAQLGFECAWTSEIDPFPSAVVEARWGFPNLGDMTKIDTEEAIHEHGPIELLVGGTPCQSFSVAGLRKGMDDPRGNLALVFLRLLDGLRPRWVVWENVPGVLSSSGGRDFGAFLGGLEELGYGWAYRTLDAQYIRVDAHARAVPQRRKRVFVVGCLGDWRGPASVFLEREGLRGDPAPRREAGTGVARTLGASTGGCSGKEQQHTFVGSGGEPMNPLDVEQPYTVGNTLTASMSKGFNTTLDSGQTPVVAFDTTQITHPENRSRLDPGGPSPTLSKLGHAPCVFSITPESGGGADLTARETEVAGTVNTTDEASQTDRGTRVVETSGVRRLTPRECERLQGFPDDHTLVEFNKKPASDTRRYRALGNSMAVNAMRWIGQRIEIADGLIEVPGSVRDSA